MVAAPSVGGPQDSRWCPCLIPPSPLPDVPGPDRSREPGCAAEQRRGLVDVTALAAGEDAACANQIVDGQQLSVGGRPNWPVAFKVTAASQASQ